MISIRMVLGLVVGLIISSVLGVTGLSRLIVLLGCSAPVGYTTLVFSTLEGLDKKFAANAVSLSILIGVVWVPTVIVIFG